MDLETLNNLPKRDFVEMLKDVWPDGIWVAETVEDQRPFQSIRSLHQSMADVVKNATARQKLSLLDAFNTPQMKDQLRQRIDHAQEELKGEEPLHKAFEAYENQFGFPYFAALDLDDLLPEPDDLNGRLDNDLAEERMFALRHVSEQARARLEKLLK
ncbi:MAG: 2-oxo-4-hydroxy-4-carboxy-5-ureidoimidazoline decarboxylase [Pseudomonadota bacterium]